MIWHKKNKQIITALFVERRPIFNYNHWSLMNDLEIILLEIYYESSKGDLAGEAYGI